MKNYINIVECQELNSFVDVNKANNGGGYAQPKITYSGYFNNRSIVVTITDTSCGEFGSRYSVDVEYKNKCYKYYYSSVGNCIEEYGNIPQDISDMIYDITSYWCDYDVSKDASFDDIYIEL
jgi:hypothetical protein